MHTRDHGIGGKLIYVSFHVVLALLSTVNQTLQAWQTKIYLKLSKSHFQKKNCNLIFKKKQKKRQNSQIDKLSSKLPLSSPPPHTHTKKKIYKNVIPPPPKKKKKKKIFIFLGKNRRSKFWPQKSAKTAYTFLYPHPLGYAPFCSHIKYCKFGNFREGFIYPKLKPREMTKSLCRLLI